MAMYEAKNKGKNGSSLYTKELYKKMERKARIEKDLPIALVNKEFYLVYQPQIDTTTNKIIGAEALIRWKHPLLGDISPCEFIPILSVNSSVTYFGLTCTSFNICEMYTFFCYAWNVWPYFISCMR